MVRLAAGSGTASAPRQRAGVSGAVRVRRLMTKMGLAPIYQRPKTREPHPPAPDIAIPCFAT